MLFLVILISSTSFFFFSGRSRHTRSYGDWSSDVCSSDLQPGDSYVAFGTGTVGCAGLLAAKLAGCDPIIAVDVFDERLALARSLGATHTVNAKDPQLVDEVRRLAGGRGAKFCLEAAGF